MNNTVENYGWESARPHSCNYLALPILEIMKKLNVRRVLDIGSGNGVLCSELTGNGFDCVGVEFDKQGVEIAKKDYPAIPFYNYGVQDDPAEILEQEDLFGAVVSTEVIEHLYSPHLLPIFASKVLKENGYLVITTPYHGFLKNLVLSLFNHWDQHHTALWHGGHIKFWSRGTLTQLLEDNGFEVVEFSGVGRVPYLWKSMIITARKCG
jgi:2-polyprenyl-3-methyl-5-hydroxy-6-metoxy-1,4-benzoquinol methylase